MRDTQGKEARKDQAIQRQTLVYLMLLPDHSHGAIAGKHGAIAGKHGAIAGKHGAIARKHGAIAGGSRQEGARFFIARLCSRPEPHPPSFVLLLQ